MPVPHFTVKNQFQKQASTYRELLTNRILEDVCHRITGQRDFTAEFDDAGYNKGRLARLEFRGRNNYISFSETEITARNSSLQSFPSALVAFNQDPNPNKRIFFYFLPNVGNIETPYFVFIYRLMKTAGVVFLNEADFLDHRIVPFASVADIIAQRDANRARNQGNRSTYLTIGENEALQIYGKTYGANKYETTLIAIASHRISPYDVELYEIKEGNLKLLPANARTTIAQLGIRIITSDLALERREFEQNDSLRSPTFTYNLLDKLGDKRCSLCACEIPQLVQGAHIWPVAQIKREPVNLERKLRFALDRDNGIWLCNNHHKLFDIDFLMITEDGRLKYRSGMARSHEGYITAVTSNARLPTGILNPTFVTYLRRRNATLQPAGYSFL